MPKFVKVCKNDFTTFHNAMWRDSTLDFPERGLLGTMLTLPDNWNFSIKGLAAIVPSGEHKISSSLKKLEKAGYLKREAIRNNGRIVDWRYSFSDEPIFRDEDSTESTVITVKKEKLDSGMTLGTPKKGQSICVPSPSECSETVSGDMSISMLKSSLIANESKGHSVIITDPKNEGVLSCGVENYVENNVENSPETPHCGNRNVANSEAEETPHCGFQDVGNSDVKNRNANQILSNQILSNQNLSINQSKTKVEKVNVENFSDEIDEMDFKEAVDEVEDQILADRLRDEKEPEIIDEIVDVIASMFVTKQRHRKIGGDKLSVSLIQRRLRQLEYEHICYVVECLSENTTAIKNRRSYLLTCLYNAPMTMDGYYANQVAHGLYGS